MPPGIGYNNPFGNVPLQEVLNKQFGDRRGQKQQQQIQAPPGINLMELMRMLQQNQQQFGEATGGTFRTGGIRDNRPKFGLDDLRGPQERQEEIARRQSNFTSPEELGNNARAAVAQQRLLQGDRNEVLYGSRERPARTEPLREIENRGSVGAEPPQREFFEVNPYAGPQLDAIFGEGGSPKFDALVQRRGQGESGPTSPFVAPQMTPERWWRLAGQSGLDGINAVTQGITKERNLLEGVPDLDVDPRLRGLGKALYTGASFMHPGARILGPMVEAGVRSGANQLEHLSPLDLVPEGVSGVIRRLLGY